MLGNLQMLAACAYEPLLSFSFAQGSASRNDDDHAEKTVHRLLHFFALAISTLINTIDSDTIIIGGGVGNIDFLYTDGLSKIKRHVFNLEYNILILKPRLGDSAGVFGAVFLY